MRLEALGEFIALVKYGSIGRAAKELYLSPSTLSGHIASLERDLGFTLFERDERGVTLTPAGTAFLAYAQTAADAIEEGRAAGAAAARRPQPVRMRATEMTGRLRGDQDVSFVEVDYGTTTLDALEHGLIDVALDADYRGIAGMGEKIAAMGLTCLPAGELACSIAVMATHPLAGRTSLCRADLDGQTVVIAGGAYFDEWSRVVQAVLGADVRVHFRMSPARSTADVAAKDFGGAIHLCGREANEVFYRHRSDVVLFDTLDGQPLVWPATVMYRADNPNPAVAPFAEHLAARLRR